jgi:hypothetical protein
MVAAGSAPTLAIVGSDKDNDADDALAAAMQNAAPEDIHVAEDEQEVIRLHHPVRSTRRSSCAAPPTSPSARPKGGPS